MDLGSVCRIGREHKQEQRSSLFWWSRGERLENLRSQQLLGLKLRSAGC